MTPKFSKIMEGSEEWKADNSVPDPEYLPVMQGTACLFRPYKAPQKTKGGIFIPDKTQNDMSILTQVGRCVSMGPKALEKKDDLVFEVGDYVGWRRYAGDKFEYAGIIYVLLDAEQIMFKVPDPRLCGVNFIGNYEDE